MNSSENNGNGFATESVTTDFKSFNVDVIALGDLQINDNIGLFNWCKLSSQAIQSKRRII
jgi:hypothetical protein